MLCPTLTVAPVEKPIALNMTKAHARIDHDDDDIYVEGLIDAAIARVDGYTGILGRCMITQTWSQTFPKWGTGLRLSLPDVQSVVLKYRDDNDDEQTIPSSHYEIVEDAQSAVVIYRDAFVTPSLNSDRYAPVTAEMTAGYGDQPDDVPAAIRHALYMLVGHWYENRETVAGGAMTTVPESTDALLAPYRRIGV